MKIAFDARVLMDKHYSGVSQYSAKLLAAILKLDKENTYSLFYNSYKKKNINLQVFSAPNLKLKGLNYPNKIFNYFLQKILHLPKLDKVAGDVDVFFAPHLNFISLSDKTKFVITVHDLSFLRYPEFFSRRKNFWHQALHIKKLLQRAEAIVAVSNNTKHDLVEILAIDEKKIKVIYSGNNYQQEENLLNEDRTKSTNVLEKFSLTPGYILFVGNIEPRKNIVNLIEAYNKLRNEKGDLAKVQLVLAGLPAWKHKKIYKSRELSDYRNDIKFLGYVTDSEKSELYRQAGVFAYPSFYEGFGFPPLEAMSHSLPVVSSNVSSLPEVLGEAALLVNPFKSEDIKEALVLALQDEKLRASLIAKGKLRTSLFSWEKTAKEYLELFASLKS